MNRTFDGWHECSSRCVTPFLHYISILGETKQESEYESNEHVGEGRRKGNLFLKFIHYETATV